MAGPWDRYKKDDQEGGPWSRYGGERGLSDRLRSFAERRVVPEPERSRPEAFDRAREDLITNEERDRRGMAEIDANARNAVVGARMAAAGPIRSAADFAEGVIDAPANMAAEVLDNPVETLLYPLTAPTRAWNAYWGVNNYLDPSEYMNPPNRTFGQEVFSGHPLRAVDEAIDVATPAGETALLATPVRALRAPRGPGRMSRSVADFERSNVEPYAAGVAAETPASGLYGRVTQVTAENPVAGLPVRGQMRRRAEQAETQSRALADQFSPARTPAEGGASVRRGVGEFARDRFPAEAEQRYSSIWGRLNRGRFASTSGARATLNTLNQRFSNRALATMFANPRLVRLREILESPDPTNRSLSFGDLRELRSEVRRMRQDQGLMRDVRDADLAQLERALTADIYAGVRSAARPGTNARQALADLQATDRWYRETATMIREDLERFATDTAEGAFRTARTAARGGGSGAINELRSLMRSLEPEQRRDLAATILHDMADNGGRDFTPTAWAAAWEKMGPEAKDVLFGSAGSQARENLEAYYRVMRSMRETSRYTNFSNSFSAGQALATAGSFGAAPVASSIAHAAWAAGGRLMMSPNFTRVLARTAELEAAGVDAATLYGRQYAAIAALGQAEPRLLPDYQRVLEALPPPQARPALPPPGSATRPPAQVQ